MKSVTVRVPATTANLGPGFDCLGMALDIWNEAIISLEGRGRVAVVTGEGADKIPANHNNLILKSAMRVFDLVGKKPEPGILVRSFNEIPVGSGLGSSAAAALTGVLGANALLGNPLNRQQILELVTEIEHHPDNAAAALAGGLVLVGMVNNQIIYRSEWDGTMGGDILQAAVVLPDVALSTVVARKALPKKVALSDAVSNMAMNAFVLEAFRNNDLGLLGDVMVDKLHQPYRLPLIPGAAEAIMAARKSGAAAAVLSGAGPSVIAFGLEGLDQVAKSMQNAFKEAGKSSRIFLTHVSSQGAHTIIKEER